MYQISPVRDWADLALEWADLGFTMYQISPLQQVSYPFPKTNIRQGWYLNQLEPVPSGDLDLGK